MKNQFSLARISIIIAYIVIAAGFTKEPSKKHYLIIANASSLNKNHLEHAKEGRLTIALDGAADKMKSFGIIPDIILGDFDSIQDHDYWGIKQTFTNIDVQSKPYRGRHNVLIVPAKNQDLTDLEKAIIYCDQDQVTSILIINATDERMDHTLYNTRLLRKYHKDDRPLMIRTPTATLEYIKDGITEITGFPGDTCAIMAFPYGYFTSRGLTYDVTNYPLEFGRSESVCNSLKEKTATIEITGEALVIHPYRELE